MEVNGTEVGLSIGAVITTLLGYLGFKSRREDPIVLLRKEIERIKGRQNRFEDALRVIVESSKEDTKQIKSDIRLISTAMNNMALSLARLNALHEAREDAQKTS